MTLDTEKQEFSDISEIKADTPSIGATIFSTFCPYDIGDITETPRSHDI